MVKVGAVDPRNGMPSMSALGKMSKTHTSTITAMVFSDRETDPAVVERVADALGIDVRTVSRWAGKSRTVLDPYIPPMEADMLSTRQRRAVSELIRSMAEPSNRHPHANHSQSGTDQAIFTLAADDHSGDEIGFDDEPHDT